ncbi:DNA-binding protein (plasmid) [Agrobacterium vitis]|uniref:DNA-binding protein n=1 Tax=Agrobacterium vitis TaxID=373 RepID=UPI003D2C2633
MTNVLADPVSEMPGGKSPSAASVVPEVNRTVAAKLREYGDLLVQQGEGGFRSRAYDQAADMIGGLERPVDDILAQEGRAGLLALPAVGYGIASAIAEMLASGRWSQLERLRGELVPEALFRTIPGIGPMLASRLAEEGQLESLEDLEHALHFGDLAFKGFGERRKRMIGAALAERLGRPARAAGSQRTAPSVRLLLEVDRTYRERASASQLPRIALRRFNPKGEAWLPIMHTRREGWHFTALYSNSRLAHELDRTRDWVVIHYQRDGEPEGRCTVVTGSRGPLAGQRIVRGREHPSEDRKELQL